MPQRSSGSGAGQVSVFERVAWYALLALPVAVPVAVSKVPFTSMAPFAFNLFAYAKLFALGWCVGVALIAWAAGVLTGAIETRTVPLRWWLAAFLGLAAVSTMVGLDPTTAFFGGQYWADGLLVLLLGGAVYLLVTQLITSVRRVRAFTWATVAGGLIVAVIGLLQVLGYDPLGSVGPGFIAARGASLLGNPDFTGTYLVVPAVLSAALALSESDLRWRIAAASSFVVLTAALVATLTRGAWIGVALGLVVLGVAFARSGVRTPRQVWTAVAAVAVAVAVPALLVLRDPTRAARQIADLFSGGGAAGSGRLILWKEALAITARHPLFGTGPDSYRLGWYAVRTAASVRLTGLATISEDPHNILLLLAATLGIPAAVAVIGLIVSALGTSAAGAFSKSAGGGRLAYAGWWAALAGLGAALMFGTNTTPVVVALFSGAGVLVAARAKPAVWPAAERMTVGALAAVLALVALVVATLTISADATLMRAQTSPDKVALAGQAAAIAPWYTLARNQSVFGQAAAVTAALGARDPQALAQAATVESEIRDMIRSSPHEYKNYAQLASFLDNTAPVLGGDAFQRAAAAADSALGVYPVSSEAAYLKALAQLGQNDAAGAVRTLQPMWEIDPGYPEAGVAYGEALRVDGQLPQAQAVVGTLEKRFPGNQDVARLAARVAADAAKAKAK